MYKIKKLQYEIRKLKEVRRINRNLGYLGVVNSCNTKIEAFEKEIQILKAGNKQGT